MGRDANERGGATWRKLELLPDFDKTGRGRGRGAGRAPSVWTHGDAALNQAAWVYDLLRMYGTFDAIYLPLWILGCPIPLWRVRQALATPLEAVADSIARSRFAGKAQIGVEDVIDDAVHEFTQNAQRLGVKPSQPEDALETFMNLVFNSNYNLADPLIKETIARLWNWRRALKFARFINRHLSLRGFNEAVDKAADDDLMAVRRDLDVLREIVCLFGRMIERLPAVVRERLKESFADKLPALFSIGKLCIFVDLSLRRIGYGERINHELQTVLGHMRGEFGEQLKRELLAASSRLANGGE